MKKLYLNRMVAALLAVVMVLPCVLVTSMPASAAESNWIPSAGTEILEETSETWIVDTVTVEFGDGSPYKSFVQHTEKLTELIGKDGSDGRSYVHVSVEDGTTGTAWRTYVHMQLVGSSDTSATIDAAPSSKAMTWYLYNNGASFLVSRNHGTNPRGYGTFGDAASRGVKLTFTEFDGYVIPRAIDNGAYQSMSNYMDADTQNLKSEYTLDQIAGDNGGTGEDGVYLRFHTQCGSIKLKCTFTVAYPKPADFDYNASHWIVKNGARILSESVETYKLDTVKAKYASGEKGYIQHKQKMTDLIGKNSTDGKGWVSFTLNESGATQDWYTAKRYTYAVIQLVGSSDTSSMIEMSDKVNAMSWYLRATGQGASDNVMLMRGDQGSGPYYCLATDGTEEIIARDGYKFAFTNNNGYVIPRAIGVGAQADLFGYGAVSSQNLGSAQTLAQLPGDNGGTGEDGVYLRIRSKRSGNLVATTSVFYPVSDIESVQPEITDSISLYWTAMVADQIKTPVMKFSMDGKDDVVVAGTKNTRGRWVFAYTDILPQDLGKNIQASLYDGDGENATLLSTCVYSMETYCRNKLINNTTYASDDALWKLLLNLLDYGSEAQTYFEKEGTLVNSSVREAFAHGYNDTAPTITEINARLAALDAARKADMSNATAVSTLIAGEAVEGYKWQAATLSLQDYVKVRFKFTAPVDEKFSVKIGDAEYTLENGGIIKAGNSYYVYTDGISVSDFAKEFTAAFYYDGVQVGQTVTYSVNTYINWMSGQTVETADAYNLVQALYNYSVSAKAYNG
ncbi:MAG: hypothetical protein IKU26_04715 [Clostridia bacterium]|nr:hypothetical protein [Clostridia bacterium]